MTDQASHDWRETQERSNLLALKLMVWISLRLGRPIARLILVAIAFYFLLFAPKARAASKNYLQRVLQRPPAWTDLFKHFHTFATTIHDRIFLLNDRFESFEVDSEGFAEVLEEAQKRPGALLVGAHLGSFEVLRVLGINKAGIQVSMLMYEDNARMINATLNSINPKLQSDIVSLGRMDSMLEVRDRLDEGRLVGILADRFFNDEAGTPCQFLGSQVQLPLGPWRAAAMMKRPVFFMVGLYMGKGRYRVRFHRLVDFTSVARGERDAVLKKAVQDYADWLSFYCREAPYNWFNFFDYWKTK